MKNIYSFKGFIPVIDTSAFIHPQSTIIGNVIIGKDVYVGPSAVIRGDWGGIIINDGCNIQETCVIHVFPGKSIILKRNAHIGHGAIIHGANIGENVLVGMNAVVMDNADVGDGSIIGALTFVPAEMIIPPRSVVVGNPAKIVKQVSDEMLEWKTKGTKLYQILPDDLRTSMKPVKPLRSVPKNRKAQESLYQPWKEEEKKL
ncbi:MAG: transferase hexapeptide repeat family protein [Bacteriovoracaceae bacterium]|nr:transferase hexapeptide repeat family protein [Bacteroidota bacterium]